MTSHHQMSFQTKAASKLLSSEMITPEDTRSARVCLVFTAFTVFTRFHAFLHTFRGTRFKLLTNHNELLR